VQIAGMVDENMNTEQLNAPAQPWEFRSKPAWQRIIVMLGGIIFNVLLGIFIFAMISYNYGEKLLLNSSLEGGIFPSELASEIGFRTGDKIVSVNGKQIHYFDEAMTAEIVMSDNATYEVERDGKLISITLPNDFLKKLTKNTRSIFFTPRIHLYVEKVVSGSAADKAGLKADDQIVSVNQDTIVYFDQFKEALKVNASKEITLSYIRQGNLISTQVNVDQTGKIGFMPYDKNFKFETINYSLGGSFPAGLKRAYETIYTQIAGWGKIFKGDIPINKAVQGPVGIAQYFGPTWDWLNFWLLTAMISLGLAFANVMPIPALDGGHVVVLLIEMIIGKPLSIKVQERIQTAGMIIILGLVILIFGNDIWQLTSR
jgi:regulator of sigma E protease